MKVLIIDNGTKNLELIKGFFIGDEVVIVGCYDITFSDSENYDLIILTGSGSGVVPAAYKSDEALKNELEIIKNSTKPIIGICYGCELIAHAFQCKIQKIEPRITNFVDIVGPGSILGLKKNYIKVFDNHKYIITELSDEIDGLAKSSTGYEVIKHKTKNIFGTQFHPEKFQELTEGDDVLRKIIEIIKKDQLSK